LVIYQPQGVSRLASHSDPCAFFVSTVPETTYSPSHVRPAVQRWTRINDEIRAAKILLIDQNGEKQGIMPITAALEAAEEVGLDLVEISPNSDPPVCKLLDYGKFKFQEQKRRTRRASVRRP